jgi:hypothetical protein
MELLFDIHWDIYTEHTDRFQMPASNRSNMLFSNCSAPSCLPNLPQS